MRSATAALLLFVLVAGMSLAACQSSDRQDAPASAIPPRGSIEFPPKPEAAAAPAPAEACKHVWESATTMTHSYTVTEDGIPMVKLCTPIVCKKCGLVRHECEKELRRRHR